MLIRSEYYSHTRKLQIQTKPLFGAMFFSKPSQTMRLEESVAAAQEQEHCQASLP